MRLEVFGSVTREDFDLQHSDIDLLVEFAPGTDLGSWIARFFELQERLETVLGRKVDLVMANGLHNPYLMRSINQERQPMFSEQRSWSLAH